MATATENQLQFDGTHPDQRAFVNNQDRYVAFVSGIGAGKTVGGIGRLLRNVFTWNAGYTGYVVAPTVPSLRNVIIPEMEKWSVTNYADFNRSHGRLEFTNGSTVILESADNDRKIERLRGPSIAWFWMDEAATISKRAWDIMVGRLREGDYLNAFVTTTPKGYNWVYDRFVDAEDASVIQGVPSIANPHLPDEYEEITDEYEGVFYEQEVLGKFRQAEGLVYQWFGPEHVVEETPDKTDKTIYGLDFGGAVPTAIVALQQSGEEWYVVDEFYQPRVTDDTIADELRRMYDQHGHGPVYADHEPRTIEKLNREGINAKEADKSVDEGIRHVSGQRENLYVADWCQNTINEFNQYRYKDDSDDVLKEHDHACLVEGTKVETLHGSKNIEHIDPGELVLTREGYRPVLTAKLTEKNAEVISLRTINGRILTGTPDHLVHTENGFKQMDTLEYGEVISNTAPYRKAWQPSMKSSTKASRSEGIQNQTTRRTGSIIAHTRDISRTASKPYTGRSGETTTARSPKATISTTRTGTHQTTISRISNVSHPRSTPEGTPRSAASNQKSISRKCSKPLKGGTSQMRGRNGIDSTQRKFGKIENPKQRSANNAARSSSTSIMPGFAQTPVKQSGEENQEKTTKSESALSADQSLLQTNITTQKPARVSALESHSRGRNVYNLNVAYESEYFANGLLVHNCDALRYALFTDHSALEGGAVSIEW